MRKWRQVLTVVLGIAAVAAIVLGVMYAVVPAHSLPSFIPGHTSGHGHSSAKHTKRGYAGIAVGVVLLVLTIVLAMAGGRRRRKSW